MSHRSSDHLTSTGCRRRRSHDQFSSSDHVIASRANYKCQPGEPHLKMSARDAEHLGNDARS